MRTRPVVSLVGSATEKAAIAECIADLSIAIGTTRSELVLLGRQGYNALVHDLERDNPNIDIPDKAFKQI